MKKKLEDLLLAFLAGAPFLMAVPACSFTAPQSPFSQIPRTSAIFCDIEADRRCSTEQDRMEGIDVSRPFEDGFWVGRSSPIGLDFSPAALAACGGQPQAVIYLSAFPDGESVCLNPGLIPGTYATVNEACQAWCFSKGLIDGNGDPFQCSFIAWQSNGAGTPFPDACTEAGVLRGDFLDPRKVPPPTPTPPAPAPVAWTAAVGVTVTGADLTKPATEATQWGNSGAISTQQLAAGDGSVFITASETTTFRIFGLGTGNVSASFEDIEFGLLLTQTGTLQVVEAGIDRGVVGAYATGDTLEVSVVGGAVQYKNNGALLFTSTVAPAYPLLVDAALFDANATFTAARVIF